jgi:hypothetical protein
MNQSDTSDALTLFCDWLYELKYNQTDPAHGKMARLLWNAKATEITAEPLIHQLQQYQSCTNKQISEFL